MVTRFFSGSNSYLLLLHLFLLLLLLLLALFFFAKFKQLIALHWRFSWCVVTHSLITLHHVPYMDFFFLFFLQSFFYARYVLCCSIIVNLHLYHGNTMENEIASLNRSERDMYSLLSNWNKSIDACFENIVWICYRCDIKVI